VWESVGVGEYGCAHVQLQNIEVAEVALGFNRD
jgi:hypothetical protein